MRLKMIAVFAVLFSNLSGNLAFATGGFDCESEGKFVRVKGISGSAGVYVQEVWLGKRQVTDFSADQIYLGDTWFAFLIMDSDRNKRILRVETISAVSNDDYVTNGYAWVGPQKNVAKIDCAFSY